MAYLSVPKISRHLIFLHLSSPFIVDNCSYISILSFAITYLLSKERIHASQQSVRQRLKRRTRMIGRLISQLNIHTRNR